MAFRAQPVVAFLLVLTLLLTPSLGVTHAASPDPKTFSNRPAPSTEDPDLIFTTILFHLYNHLIVKGFLNAPPLNSPPQIWQRDFSDFLAALLLFEPTKGGYVTPLELYYWNEHPLVYFGGAEQNDLFLNFSNPSQTIPIGRRYGFLPNTCSVVPVNEYTENLAVVIAQNSQCLYVQYLSSAYQAVPAPKPPFNYGYILNQSGVGAHLQDYLNGLVASGLVSNYMVDVANDSLSVQVFPGTAGLPSAQIALPPHLVNVLSPQEE